MKPTIVVFFVVLLALAVISVPANHHKKHRGNDVKADEYYTTYQPTDVTYTDGEDFEWPDRALVRNVELPKAFGPGRLDITRTELGAYVSQRDVKWPVAFLKNWAIK